MRWQSSRERLVSIAIWTVILTLWIACLFFYGCAEPVHDQAWRDKHDKPNPVMQFLGKIAEGSF